MTKFTALYSQEMKFLVKFLKIKNFKFIRIKFKFENFQNFFAWIN